MQTLQHTDFIIQYHLVDGDIEFIISNKNKHYEYVGLINSSYIQNTDFFKSIEKLYDALGQKDAIKVEIETLDEKLILSIKVDIRIYVETVKIECAKRDIFEPLTKQELKIYSKIDELTKQIDLLKDQNQRLQFELNCLKECNIITDKYKYVNTYVRLTQNKLQQISFNTKTDAHIGLFDVDKILTEIVIGGWNNTNTCIREQMQGVPTVETKQILCNDGWTDIYLEINDKLLNIYNSSMKIVISYTFRNKHNSVDIYVSSWNQLCYWKLI